MKRAKRFILYSKLLGKSSFSFCCSEGEKLSKEEFYSVLDEAIPHLSVTLTEEDKEKCKYAQVLMKSTLLGIKGVAQEFSKFIKIKEKQND